jgi:hypothetical protein
MPNECRNQLVVQGNVQSLSKFRDMAFDSTKNETSLNVLFPTPEGVDWYEWNNENWGSKWGAYDIETDEVDINEDDDFGLIRYTFTSAWAPPEGLIERIANIHPDLEFGLSYSEWGIGFCGFHVWRDGETVAEMCEEPEMPKKVVRAVDNDKWELYYDWTGDCEGKMCEKVEGYLSR